MQQTLYDIKTLLHMCMITNASIKRETVYPVYLCITRNCLTRLTENMKVSKDFTKELQTLVKTFTNIAATESIDANSEIALQATLLLNKIKQLQIIQDIDDIDIAKQYIYAMHTHMHTVQNIPEAVIFLEKFKHITQPTTGTIVNKFVIKSHMYLRTLLQQHCTTQITNLHEFNNIKFYHNVSTHFVSVVLYHKYNLTMLLGSDKKTYVIINNKLVQAKKHNKLICWI